MAGSEGQLFWSDYRVRLWKRWWVLIGAILDTVGLVGLVTSKPMRVGAVLLILAGLVVIVWAQVLVSRTSGTTGTKLGKNATKRTRRPMPLRQRPSAPIVAGFYAAGNLKTEGTNIAHNIGFFGGEATEGVERQGEQPKDPHSEATAERPQQAYEEPGTNRTESRLRARGTRRRFQSVRVGDLSDDGIPPHPGRSKNTNPTLTNRHSTKNAVVHTTAPTSTWVALASSQVMIESTPLTGMQIEACNPRASDAGGTVRPDLRGRMFEGMVEEMTERGNPRAMSAT